MTNSTCKIDGCEDRSRTRGWCRKHYIRWYRHGDPSVTLNHSSPTHALKNRVRQVGDCLVWTGADNGNGYGTLWAHGDQVYAHRYAWEIAHGPIPANTCIDHTCHNRACVNVNHLRLATHAENTRNKAGARADNKSTGVRNVTSRNGKFEVQVGKSGRNHYFGTYDSLTRAAEVAREARAALFGEYEGAA